MALPLAKLPYRLGQKPLGTGGYATVWPGEHRETGQPAAIKRPKEDSESLARFKREVEVQSLLDHPHVMPIIEHSLKPPWLAMPIATRSLTRAIERGVDLDHHLELIDVMRQAARGLAYAHGRGYTHRDVNPNNLLEVKEDDGTSRWVVSDWGLVRKPPSGKSSPRLTRRAIGTEGFIAPEAELDPHNADEPCDVYSLGRMAHFALTKTWPRASFPLPEPHWLWKEFVESCTAEREKRAKTMGRALALLSKIDAQLQGMETQAQDLICPVCELPMDGARCPRCGRFWD
jgi:eukaryotic-like serine/threonine-protein kinase